jgi:hypothetical protein
MELIFGDKKNSGGDKSGEYLEWFNSEIPCFAKNCFIDTAV